MNTRVLLIISTILLLLTTATSAFWYIEKSNLIKIVEDCEKGRELVESEVVSFEKKIQKLEQELSDTSAELGSQKSKLNVIKKDLIIAQNRIDYLLRTGQIDKQRAEKLQKKIKEYEEKILAVTPGAKKIEEAFEKIVNVNELEVAQNLNKKYEEEIARLQQQINVLTAEAGSLQNQLSNLQTRLEIQTQYKVMPIGKFWYKNGERGLIKDNRTNKVTGKKAFRIYFTVLPKQYEAPISGLTTKVVYETGIGQAVSYSYDSFFKEFYIQLDPKTKGRIVFYNGDTEISNYVF
jgi:peptidoglycan hydrolase CwlO-like protein